MTTPATTSTTTPALPFRPALVLLDLDGTLTDSAPGIISSMRHALTTLGLSVPDAAGFRSMVGPPLHVSLQEQGVPAARADEAIAVYREEFVRTGMLDGNSVFPGVTHALARLRAAGVPLAVATSKPEVFARRIVAHFDLAGVITGGLDGVFGADLDGGPRASKAAVIAHALATLGAREDLLPGGLPAVEQVVMVGDRSHDVAGAAAHGIATVGVAWGYATPGELEDAGAAAIVATPGELADLLLGA